MESHYLPAWFFSRDNDEGLRVYTGYRSFFGHTKCIPSNGSGTVKSNTPLQDTWALWLSAAELAVLG